MKWKEKLKVEAAVWLIRGLLRNEDNLQRRLTVAWLKKFLREDKMGDDSKPWWKSKTLIVNALTGIAGVFVALTQDKGIDPYIVGYITTALGVVNVILRLVTDKPIR